MLVLSRKIEEGFRIGEDVVIRVYKIAGNRVTIGIDAPKHVRVIRLEIEDKNKLEELEYFTRRAREHSPEAKSNGSPRHDSEVVKEVPASESVAAGKPHNLPESPG